MVAMLCRKFVLCAALAVLQVGCDAHRKNADPKDVLLGYQPQPIASANCELVRVGDNKFKVKVRGFDGQVAIQKNPVWCWAAASETILRNSQPPVRTASGAPITQDDLIRHIASHKRDQSADELTMLRALAPELSEEYNKQKTISSNRRWETNCGKYARWEDYQPDKPGIPDMVESLLKGQLVMMAIDPDAGDLGHCVVIDEAVFSMAAVDFGSQAPYFVHEAHGIDPETGGPFVAMAENDLMRVKFCSSRDSAITFMALAIDGYKRSGCVSN